MGLEAGHLASAWECWAQPGSPVVWRECNGMERGRDWDGMGMERGQCGMSMGWDGDSVGWSGDSVGWKGDSMGWEWNGHSVRMQCG